MIPTRAKIPTSTAKHATKKTPNPTKSKQPRTPIFLFHHLSFYILTPNLILQGKKMHNFVRRDMMIVPDLQNPNNSTLKDGSFLGPAIYNWLFECHGLLHNVTLILSSFAFVLYLGSQAKKSYTRLSHGRSHTMIAYYGSLWLVSLLNLAWCCSQVWECTSGKELSWNILSLFTSSGMLFLEVSLISFLLQGNHASGLEALTRTFGLSALVVGLDILLKAIYLFGFGIPLFIDNEEHTHHMKWSLWVIHRLVLTAIYGIILFMYHSDWREKLPARPAFYKYFVVMLILNAVSLFACAITGYGARFGYWLYGTMIVCYHAFYLPILYGTFLADFFQEEGLHLENVYYSEMKDAGFFDEDWE